jgi:hypothetical protein
MGVKNMTPFRVTRFPDNMAKQKPGRRGQQRRRAVQQPCMRERMGKITEKR